MGSTRDAKRAIAIPDSVGAEYAGGAKSELLVQKYEVSWERLREKLISLGVELRPSGRRKGSENPNCRKIDRSGHQKIAALHLQGLTHAEIGRQLGITRERVRQIVATLGLCDRSAIRKKLAAEQRKAKSRERRQEATFRRRVIKTASTLWKKGAHWTEVARVLKWKCTRAGGFHSALGDLREKHGAAAFPIRQSWHWNRKRKKATKTKARTAQG